MSKRKVSIIINKYIRTPDAYFSEAYLSKMTIPTQALSSFRPPCEHVHGIATIRSTYCGMVWSCLDAKTRLCVKSHVKLLKNTRQY